MDLAAELTMKLACFLQSGPNAPRSSTRWGFVPGPGGGRLSYLEARAKLHETEKPLMLGPLHEPGYLASWRSVAFDEAERQSVEHALRNQQAYLDGKLAKLGATDDDLVLFEGWADRLELPVAELRRWSREYVIVPGGWTVISCTDSTHRVRLVMSHPLERWSPNDVPRHLVGVT